MAGGPPPCAPVFSVVIGAGLTPRQVRYNLVMSKLRQAVEWSFGKVTNIWAFIDFKKNQKLYLQPVAKYYLVGVLLKNCHSCMYGNQTSRYFQVPTPELEDYLANA